MLSTLKIKSAKPEMRAFKLADSGGLYVLIQPNGAKLWRYKFRVAGKEGLQALGAFPRYVWQKPERCTPSLVSSWPKA